MPIPQNAAPLRGSPPQGSTTFPKRYHRTVPSTQQYRYRAMTQRKATFEAVLDACRKLLEQGKPTSATNILSIVGGSKQTVLEARRAALATLMEEGRGTDPSAAFQAAAD